MDIEFLPRGASLGTNRFQARTCVLVAAMLVLACRSGSAQPGPADAPPGPTGGAQAEPGGRGESPTAEGPRRLDLAVRAVAPDGARALGSEDAGTVDPASRFELDMPALADVRIRLFDESDQAVPSVDRLELGSRTLYSLAPAVALVPGSRYVLRVDGLRADNPTDSHGMEFEPARLQFRTAGEKPPREVQPSKRKKPERTRATAKKRR